MICLQNSGVIERASGERAKSACVPRKRPRNASFLRMTNCRRSGASSRSSGPKTIYQALIEAELSSVIGALPHQRTDAPHRIPERVPGPDAVLQRGGPGAADPQAARRRRSWSATGGEIRARRRAEADPVRAEILWLTDRRCRGWGRKRSPMV